MKHIHVLADLQQDFGVVDGVKVDQKTTRTF
jgi:hypothetical protein